METLELQFDKRIEKIQKTVADIESHASKGYLKIVGDIALLKDEKAYQMKGFANITEMTQELFGMSKSTTYNLLSINKRFCTDYKIADEYKNYTVRDMLSIIADEKKAKLIDKAEEVEDKTEEVEDKTEEVESKTDEVEKPLKVLSSPIEIDTLSDIGKGIVELLEGDYPKVLKASKLVIGIYR